MKYYFCKRYHLIYNVMQYIYKYQSPIGGITIACLLYTSLNNKDMKAFVFPGQGAQFVGMGKDLYENSALAKELFEKANDIIGYRITDIMFNGKMCIRDSSTSETSITASSPFRFKVYFPFFSSSEIASCDISATAAATAFICFPRCV